MAIIFVFAAISLFFYPKTELFHLTKAINEQLSAQKNSCDLNQQDCSIVIKSLGNVTFSITPRPIALLKKLNLRVQTEIKNISQVEVDFIGINMDMGPNQVILKAQQDGTYFATGRLPICMSHEMQWQATILIKGENISYQAVYFFSTQNK